MNSEARNKSMMPLIWFLMGVAVIGVVFWKMSDAQKKDEVKAPDQLPEFLGELKQVKINSEGIAGIVKSDWQSGLRSRRDALEEPVKTTPIP